ncbi:MAG: EAL domain-containing protein [Acidimicrobiia bacterium]
MSETPGPASPNDDDDLIAESGDDDDRPHTNEEHSILDRHGSDVVLVVDSTGRCRRASATTTKILGIEPDALAGALVLSLIHPDDHSDAARQLSLQRASSPSIYRVRRGDGAWRDMELATIRDPSMGGLVVVLRDITELNRRHESTLRTARVDDLVRRISLGFIDLAADQIGRALDLALADVGRLTQADRAYAIRFDHTTRIAHLSLEWCAPGIATLAEFRRAIPFDQLASVLDPIFRMDTVIVRSTSDLEGEAPEDAAAMRAEGVRSMVVVPISGDSQIELAVGIEAVAGERHFGADDVALLSGVGAVVNQVLRRRDHDAALVSDVDEMRGALSAAPIGIAVLDADGRYVQVNPAFCAIVGRRDSDVVGRHWYELTVAEDLELSEIAADDDVTTVFAKRYRRPTGPSPWCRVSVRPVWTPNGERRCVIAVDELSDQRRGELQAEHSRSAPVMDPAVLAALPDALIRVGDDQRWTVLNPAADRLVGAARGSDGVLDLELLDPALSSALRPLVRAAFEHAMAGAVDIEMSGDAGTFWQALVVPEASGPPIASVLIAARDLTARRMAESELAHQALHDVLTGLPNRKLFQSHLEHAVAGLVRRPSLTAVLFFDLDKFKSVNDTIGHAVGDELLVVVAQRLRAALRPEDVVARLGGDEFIVLLENLGDPSEAVTAAERLATGLGQPAMLSGHEITTAASIGIALTRDGSISPADLVKRADAAMYRAKEKGRGRVEVFDEDLQAKVTTRLQLGAGLRQAMQDDQLELHYQPEVDLVSGDVVALEALLRWRHPERGLLSASEFVTHAEELGLLVAMGDIAVNEATRVGAALNRLRPGSPLRVHINVSARQLSGSGLVESIAAALTDSSLAASLLNIDIAEGVLMGDQPGIATLVGELEALGVSVVLDGFGTAASSVLQLSRLRLGGVKIDRSIVALLPDDPGATAAVRSMVAVAGALGIRVSAVGIENRGQLDALVAAGCRYGQGLLFAGATLAAEFPAW